MKSAEAWDIFMKSKQYSPETLRKYQYLKGHWCNHFPEMPTIAFEINEYLLSLNVKDITMKKRRDIFKAMYTYLNVQLDFPNDFFKKVMNPKVQRNPRRYFSPQELFSIINSAKEGMEKVLIFLLIDSPCRIGELGQHKQKGNKTYPGLRIEMLNPHTRTMHVEGKTGAHENRLKPSICEALMQLSAPNGQVFTSIKHPEGMTTKALQECVRNIIARAGITGIKLGPHTLRHSAASLASQETGGNLLAIKALLQDSENKNAQIYIHDVEDNLKQTISPLEILQSKAPITPMQANLLPENASSSTALVPYGETPVEYVEAVPDLSEELFPMIPDNLVPTHPYLKAKDLQAIREACVHFARTAPLNNTVGNLSQLMKRILRNARTTDQESKRSNTSKDVIK
jgi:integrase